jgi:hypothetical protein
MHQHQHQHQQCVENLRVFTDSLPSTNVKFLFYLASKLDSPKIRTSMKLWNMYDPNVTEEEPERAFLAQGHDKSYVYVYKESDLKVLVEIIHKDVPKPAGTFSSGHTSVKHAFTSFFDVKILDTHMGDVNIGNHVDFGVHGLKDGHVLIKSHYTSYTNIDRLPMLRNEDNCNFVVKDQNFEDFNEFSGVTCESRDGKALGTVDNVYSTYHDRLVMFYLCGVVLGKRRHGGGVKKKYKSHKGRNYLIRCGKRGGQYIQVKGAKVYKRQQGGAPNKTYGGVTFMSETFIKFLSETIIQRVGMFREDLVSATVIFDENDELVNRGNNNIIVIYDFDNSKSNIFYLDTILLLTACYASHQISNGNETLLQPHEKICLQTIHEMMNMICVGEAGGIEVCS